MTRQELLSRMSIQEFYEWMVLEQLEPFGDRRGDLQAGIIAAVIANVNRKKNSKRLTPLDFIPKFEQPSPQQRARTLHDKFKRLKQQTDLKRELLKERL